MSLKIVSNDLRYRAKRLGKKDEAKLREEAYILPNGVASHESVSVQSLP